MLGLLRSPLSVLNLAALLLTQILKGFFGSLSFRSKKHLLVELRDPATMFRLHPAQALAATERVVKPNRSGARHHVQSPALRPRDVQNRIHGKDGKQPPRGPHRRPFCLCKGSSQKLTSSIGFKRTGRQNAKRDRVGLHMLPVVANGVPDGPTPPSVPYGSVFFFFSFPFFLVPLLGWF